eukprot:403362144
MTLSIQQQNYNENGVAFENALKSPMQNQNQLENFNIFNDKQKGDQVSSSSESFNRIVARLSKNQMKNVQEYQNSKQIPLGYQSVNSNHQFQQSNSECQPGRKTKPRTFQIEEQANFKKVKRTQLKRSFEDSNQSPSQSVSNKASQRSNNNMNQNQLMSLQMIHPINFKDAVGEKSFKPHRPSLGNGQSPQASSTSSKYCFSNRSSNLSNKQLIPEPISHKPFNNQDIVQISELKRSTDFKYQPIKRSYNLINNHQLHKKPRQNQISPAQRLQIQRQSPQRLHSGIPQVSLTIADERLHSREVSKQMPIETPKFNQYYTLLGKQNIVKVATKNTMANNLKKIDSKQGSQSQYQYSHSSLSQHNDADPQVVTVQYLVDRLSGSIEIDHPRKSFKKDSKKSNKVIKLKKSDIKFQKIEAEKKNNQNQVIQGYQRGGVMIGSPKMQQRQQEAKFEQDSSVMSSHSSYNSQEEREFELLEDDEIKISCVKAEKQINKIQFSKDPVKSYQIFLEQEKDDSQEIQYNRIRSIQQVRKSSDPTTADSLKSLQSNKNPITKVKSQVKQLQENHDLQTLRQMNNQSNNTIQQIHYKREKERIDKWGKIKIVKNRSKIQLTCLRIFNKNNQNLLKSLAYFVLNNQENMNEILSHLKEEEMCRLSIVIRSKELGQIQRLFGRQHCGMALKQSQEQMIKIWQIKHIPRIITCELSQYYSQISRALSQHDFEIEKDIDRTYPNDVNFTKNHPNHQKMLRILRATAYHIPQVGYVQGFNFIVGALIKMINNEEQVFWMNFITNLLQHGPQYILQLSLALIEYISKDLLKFKQMEDAMEYLKDFQVQNKLPIQQIFTRALEFTQVTPARLVELQKIYKTSRSNKRILFVKDQDKDVTYLKTLPNLPDDEQMTECNVDQDSIDEESDEYSELEQNKNQGRSQNFKKSQKNQINTSFHPNNVSSSMDVRPASGLDSIKNQYGKVVELKCDQTDNIVSQNDYNQRNIAFYQDSCESRLDLNQQDPYTSQYLTNESQDLTRAARVFKKINSSDRLDQNYTSNKSIESTDPTPIYQFQKSKFQQNFIISKGSLEQEQISHIIQDQEIKKQRIQKSKNINIIEQSIKSNKKVPQELLDMITKRRFLHSPSVENLKSSFKLDQKQNSKISLNISMNSENLLESEHKNNKQYEFSEYESKIKKLNNVDSEVNLIQQLRQEEDLNRIIDESHNISNIEEFYENLEYDSVNDKFQNTQKYTSRRDQREDLSERETLKLSWTKSKPLHQQLQLQFEINKNGSHLNTPHFQQSNRSNTKNQDQKKYNQGSSFDVKKSSALISKNLKSYENHDPNTNKIESYRESGLNIKINQSIRKQPSIQNLHQQNQYNEELRIVFEDNDQIKSINNFQRFTATQKNPTKQQMKNMERQKNRILHNWSANHPNVRNSQDIERVSSRNSNKNIDEVIVSMKNKHQILQQKSIQQPNSSRLANKVSLKSSQNLGYNQAPLSSRDEGKDGGTSHRSLFGQTLQFGYLNVGSSVDIEFSIKNTNKLVQLQNSNHKQVQNYHHQPSNSLGGKSVQSSSSSMMFNRSQKLQINNTIIPNQQAQQVKNCGILSPRTGINNNKHSKQLVVHKGDNYFEEGDMTTLMTPKDSFYVGSTKQNIKTTN